MQPGRDINDRSGPFAFPISADEFFDRGMTLRDYFAAAALTGLLASAESGDFARRAYALADEMLVIRHPPVPPPLYQFSPHED